MSSVSSVVRIQQQLRARLIEVMTQNVDSVHVTPTGGKICQSISDCWWKTELLTNSINRPRKSPEACPCYHNVGFALLIDDKIAAVAKMTMVAIREQILQQYLFPFDDIWKLNISYMDSVDVSIDIVWHNRHLQAFEKSKLNQYKLSYLIYI